jgi:acyl carrier protein phosphodiesterase
MSAAFRDGVRRHLRIDAFTDEHPLVHRSKARLDLRFRRFAGIIVDVYYDHLLARHWDRFCDLSLRQFTQHFHQQARPHLPELPTDMAWLLERMFEEDRLFSYLHISGVELALNRLSHRLNSRFHRGIRLEDALPNLLAGDAEFEQDFLEFFPQLVKASSSGST